MIFACMLVGLKSLVILLDYRNYMDALVSAMRSVEQVACAAESWTKKTEVLWPGPARPGCPPEIRSLDFGATGAEAFFLTRPRPCLERKLNESRGT
jgi:hypothetical protein